MPISQPAAQRGSTTSRRMVPAAPARARTRRGLSSATLGLLLLTGGPAFPSSGWFPFSPSGPVLAGSAVDASTLLVDYPGQDASKVVDTRGHLYAAADGHFYFPGTGKRVKFFGTNFMVNTIFPPNADAPQQAGEYSGIVPPDAADQLATRLARMGVNIVRLHFIDGGYARPVSIWDPGYPNDTRHFDPLQVRRLDYLIFALKRNGIYCDINLHAGRQFRAEDNVRDYDQFPYTSFNKPATQFDPVMIRLQQEYAAQLLTHINPYTNLRLADDPAVAFVEISNEDSMLIPSRIINSQPSLMCPRVCKACPVDYPRVTARNWIGSGMRGCRTNMVRTLP